MPQHSVLKKKKHSFSTNHIFMLCWLCVITLIGLLYVAFIIYQEQGLQDKIVGDNDIDIAWRM